MVNAETITTTKFVCSKCDKVYLYKAEADKCCRDKVIDWAYVNTFVLRQEHLDLMREMNVGWSECEFGAPEIDPKRPYGNSNVYEDIAEILKLRKTSDKYDEDEDDWKDDIREYMDDLHKQMQVALQIILSCQSFKLGTYKKKDAYSDHWELVK